VEIRPRITNPEAGIRPFRPVPLPLLSVLLLSLLTAAPARAQFVTATAAQSSDIVRPGAIDTLFTIDIQNSGLLDATLTSVKLLNQTSGSGSISQLDQELGSLRLYRDGGSFLRQTAASGDTVGFTALNVKVPAFGGSVRLHVLASVPLSARDDDLLDLSIEDAGGLTFQSDSWSGFPLDPSGGLRVDGMVAAQISVNPVAPDSLLAGTQDSLALLDVLLPPNGYAPDRLEMLSIDQEGTASSGGDVTGIRAWVDSNGNGKFNSHSDRSLGSLTFMGGNRWQIKGLSELVPSGGLRIFFSVSIADLASQGRTVRLALPQGEGVGMASGNDGPLDNPVRNPLFRAISTADRITFIPTPVAAATVRPGDRDVLLLNVAATNTYSSSRTLTGLTVTNATTGPGSQADRDGETRLLTLRADGDGDGLLGDLITDPVLGTTIFQAGRGSFGGFSWLLPAGQSTRLFVTADVSLTGASDSDVLSLVVANSLHIDFSVATRVAAAWPLDSGARATVDGMVANQIANGVAPTATIGPSEGPILALDVTVPRNGYASDVLDTLVMVNLGDAAESDLAELRLWRDGGDGVFTPGSGDDRDLGLLTWQAGVWRSSLLAETLDGPGARLFVGLRTAGSPRDSATVRLAIPVGGIIVRSGNDGPIDSAVENPHTITISNAPLLATVSIATPSSTVGQQIAVTMVVRNNSSESVVGILPSALVASGTGALKLTSGPSPPSFDLSPAAADTFHWVYTASATGDVMLSGSARGTGFPSGSTARSLEGNSNLHQVYGFVSAIPFTAASSMPATVTRGQADVVPLSLSFSRVDGPEAAPVRVVALRLRLEDGSGGGIVPSDLLTGITVSSGTTVYLRKTALETTGAEIALPLTLPAIIPGGQSLGLTFRLDISSSATQPNFRAVIADSTWLTAEDANSGAPVTAHLQGSTYPIRSSLGRIVSEATSLQVAAQPLPPLRVGRGEPGDSLLTLRVENPGLDGITSDIRISSFDITLTDTNGVTLARPSEHLGRIRVRTAFQVLTDRTILATDGAILTLVLSPALSVPVNTPLDLFVLGDIATDATVGPFRMQLGDSATFDARDAGTGSNVPVVYATHPVIGPVATVEDAADTLLVRGSPRFSPQITVGQTDVLALTAVLRHPGLPGTSRIRVDSLLVQVRNELRLPLVPSSYLSRVRINWNGVEIANSPDPPNFGGTVPMSLPGPLLEPGDSALIEILVDIAPNAPEGFLELMLFETGIRAVDSNLNVPTTIATYGGSEFPLSSGLTRLVPPARELVADLKDRMPAALAADGDTVRVAVLTLENTAASNSDSIYVDRLVLRACDRDFAAMPIGSAAGTVLAKVGGLVWATSGALSADSTTATLAAASPLAVRPGGSVDLELFVVLHPDPTWRTLRLGLNAAGVGVIQPGGALLQIQVQPAPGRSFPMWTEFGSVSGLSLRASYSNFPNPFAAGREPTSFAYYLREAGRVTLRIFTANGEPVATLAKNAGRPAGMNQADLWDGRNGQGKVVRNGVYIAELDVSFDGGGSDRVRRKVAVVR
jgi:hypothetical protein